MGRFVITGMGGLDGAYDFDLDELDLTLREWGWVKRHSGYMPLTLVEGLAGGDTALMVIVALIVVRRAGKLRTDEFDQAVDRFQDAPLGASIDFDLGVVVDDDADPTTPTSPESLTANDGPSGTPGKTNGATSDDVLLPPTGTHGWASSGSG